MTTPVSSLSVAISAVADFLAAKLNGIAVVVVNAPHATAKEVESNTTNPTNVLNLFVYRIIPSGFHAAAAPGDPLFVRVNVLLTPFTAPSTSEPDLDLRILGHAIRALHDYPELPALSDAALPGQAQAPSDFRSAPHVSYRLQAVLQAPSLEELNHIWTTQGGDLAYRLSAAYELSLIPIESGQSRQAAPPAEIADLDVFPHMKHRDSDGQPEGGHPPFSRWTADNEKPQPPVNWVPVMMFRSDGGLTNTLTVPDGAADTAIRIAGAPWANVNVVVSWKRQGGADQVQAAQRFVVSGAVLDNVDDSIVTLDAASAGDTAVLTIAPDVPNAREGNRLTLTVGA